MNYNWYFSEKCYCDGTEEFECEKIKSNMEALCFKKPEEDILSNEIDVDRLKSKKSSASSLKHQLEKILIIISVIIGLFVSYICASVDAVMSSLPSQTHHGEQVTPTIADRLI